MYHKIRITVVSLVVVVISMLTSATTLSYFTDSDTAVNTFVVGNISTTLAIFDDVSGEDWREFSEANYSGDNKLVPGVNNVPFYLQATNSGNVAVYQRFRVVIPSALASLIELDLPNMDSCDVKTTQGNKCSNDDYEASYDDSVVVDAEGGESVTYAEYYIVSKTALVSNGDATVEWPTNNLKITIPDGNEGEDYTELFTCADNDRNNCTLGIRIYSDAVQTTGFIGGAVSAFEGLGETY